MHYKVTMMNIHEEAARCFLCRLVCLTAAITPAKRIQKKA